MNKDNISIIEQGVGDEEGEANLFVEELTGQNNSFVPNFSGYVRNRNSAANPSDINEYIQRVAITTIDAFVANQGISPRFLKVDVEGFEWPVVQGCQKTITAHRPSFMIEVQEHADEIYDFFKTRGYVIVDADLERFERRPNLRCNLFFLPQEVYQRQLETSEISSEAIERVHADDTTLSA